GPAFWFTRPVRQLGRPLRAPLVLVIENGQAAAETLADWLSTDGLEVLRAETGEAGLAIAEKRKPAAICLDVALAGEPDGWQVLGRLKEDATTATIPVVVCAPSTGYDHAS